MQIDESLLTETINLVGELPCKQACTLYMKLILARASKSGSAPVATPPQNDPPRPGNVKKKAARGASPKGDN